MGAREAEMGGRGGGGRIFQLLLTEGRKVVW